MSGKVPEYFLLLQFESAWGSNEIQVIGGVARLKDFGQSEMVRDDGLYLSCLVNYSHVWRSGDEWRWSPMGDFEYRRAGRHQPIAGYGNVQDAHGATQARRRHPI